MANASGTSENKFGGVIDLSTTPIAKAPRGAVKEFEPELLDLMRSLTTTTAIGVSFYTVARGDYAATDAGETEWKNERQRVGAHGFIFNEREGVDFGGELGQQITVLEQLGEDHIAHGEAGTGHVFFPSGNEAHKLVVTTASGDGAEFSVSVECLVNNTGVIGEAADDVVVDFHEIAEAAGLEVFQH